MKNFSTYMIVILMIMFWIFRIVVAVLAEFQIDMMGIIPMNNTIEIVLLFVALLSMVLIVKRNLIGALIYLLGYGIYFGSDFYTKIMNMISTGGLTLTDSTSAFISLIGIILPLAALLDLALDRNRKAHPTDKKTDWFYKNEEYDRKKDERADTNNYRTL